MALGLPDMRQPGPDNPDSSFASPAKLTVITEGNWSAKQVTRAQCRRYRRSGAERSRIHEPLHNWIICRRRESHSWVHEWFSCGSTVRSDGQGIVMLLVATAGKCVAKCLPVGVIPAFHLGLV